MAGVVFLRHIGRRCCAGNWAAWVTDQGTREDGENKGVGGWGVSDFVGVRLWSQAPRCASTRLVQRYRRAARRGEELQRALRARGLEEGQVAAVRLR
ncbi:hypothetical protein ERJ75_001832500 [Trypanosoma vivax]|nr:hypothetical protein ERJ75_001832500 [Trypanosoma vivax]